MAAVEVIRSIPVLGLLIVLLCFTCTLASQGTTTKTPRPIATIGTGRLLLAEHRNSSIYSMDIQGGPHRLMLSFSGTGQYVIGVVYNERTDVLFYATGLYQGSGSRIGLINVRGGQHEEISRARGLRSIKVDPVSNLLFYATYTTIGVVSTDLRWSRLILEQGLTAVGDLALSPYEGTIFWTDAGLRAAAIGRASMDGSNFTRIISTNIDLPTALAIDIQGGLLYWFDYTTYYMYSCDQNGNNRRQLFRYSYEISAIAVDENYLYLGCQPFGYPFTSLSSLLSVRKSLTTPSAFGPIQDGEIVSMFLDKPTRYLSGSNVCSRTLNGGCGPLQRCLATGRNTRTCVCQDGYIAVNLTCQRNFTMALMNGIDSLHGTLTFLYPTVHRTLCPSPGIDRIARAVCGILGADGNNVSTTEVGSSSAGVILHGCHSQGNETDIFQCVQIYGKSCWTAVWVNCGVSGFIAPEKNIFLASSEEGAVYSISINGSHKIMVPLTSHSKPRGLAYNAQTQQLFCFQSYGGVIDRIDLSKMSVQRHNFRKFGSVRAIRLDPITNLVYYASEHAIGVASADFTRHRVLIDTNFSNYMDITLNIKQGWIFWITQRTPRIERAHMDGSSRQSIITTNITDPRALYYDIQGNYLYWIDVHSPTRIYRCRSDGSLRTLLFSTSLDLVDLVVDDKYLYAAVAYSHLTTKLWYLWKGLKDGSGGLSQFGVNETGTSYVGMALNIPSAHAQESACASRQNGGCPQEAMCLPTGVSTHVCMCFEGFIYNSNMKTCQRNYTVQLVDGTEPSNGRVVVNYKGENRSVCIDNVIGNEVAMVVCRMLGFGDTYAKLEAFGTDIHRFWLHNVLCNGDEADIAACKHLMWGDWNTCPHGNSLSVSCRPIAVSIELVDGPDSWHGRLHLKRAGQEGGLCYTADIMVAKVICQTVGYKGADISMQDYGDGNSSALLNVRTCYGNETSIANCSHDGWGRVFYCSSALGVNCGSPKEPKVALVGGWDAHHGRVEVTYQNITGSICRENLYQNEAEMICRMVGYRGGQVKTSMSYGQGNGPTLVGGLKCFGNASRTIECSHRGWRPDSGSRCTDVGIDCGPIINTMVSARLVDGEDALHGRVQVEVSNSTLQGSLCELSTLFGDNQKKLAQVVCKNLGYRGEDVEAWLYPSNTSFIASNLMCTGNETGLRQCRNPEHWGNVSKECKPKNTLHIGCGKKEDVWKVWTEGGEDKYHGRIMVSYYGFNGTVCGSGFSMNEAKVICCMLGYSGPMTNVRMTSAYGPASTDVILLDVLNCAGKENHISQCFHRGVGVYSSSICDNQPPAGVSCGLTTYSGTCGVRSPVINKIFGGDIVDITTWPWMVSMQNASRHQCGGSIISDQWIVTAAHCLGKAEELLQTTVVTGTSNIFRVNKLEYKISESYIHPSFDSSIFSSAASSYDIALLKLEKKLEFTPSIRPICLNDVQDTLPEGPCYIIGWGKVHENTNAAHQLHEAMFRVVNDSICSDLTTSFYPENQLCGGYAHGYRSICRGDSGGPLLCKRKGVDVYDLYGITSRGARCGGGSYNFFTDVSVFKSWIEATIN